MYSNSESGLNRPSNSVRRIQSMPQQPATPPPQYSLRRVATAIPVLGTYPNMHQPVHIQPVVSYPFANYNPSHEVYHDPNVRAQSDHSPIDQQREELERYRQNRQSSNNYSTVCKLFSFIYLLFSELIENFFPLLFRLSLTPRQDSWRKLLR